jgi:hypothetical protein
MVVGALSVIVVSLTVPKVPRWMVTELGDVAAWSACPSMLPTPPAPHAVTLAQSRDIQTFFENAFLMRRR